MRFGKPKDEETELDEMVTPEEEPAQLPLMMGARPEGLDGDIDLSSMSEGSRLFNKGSLLIVAVLLIAAGALYAMRLSQGDKGQSEEVKKSEARIEQLMTQLKSSQAAGGNHAMAKGSIEALMNDAEFVIAQLDVDPTKRQVPVEFTKKNPFYLFIEQAVPVAEPGKPKEDPEAKRIAELMRKLEGELTKLKIQSILPNGRKPVAIIDNKIVQIGDSVGSFKVKEIQKLAVILEAEGKDFTLSIENDPNKADVKGLKGR